MGYSIWWQGHIGAKLVSVEHKTILLHTLLIKGKGKVHPKTGHEGQEGEWRCSCTLSLTSALDGVGSQRHTLAPLAPRKARYPLCRRLGAPHGRSGQVWKISPPLGFDPRTVQAIVSLYTVYAIPVSLSSLHISARNFGSAILISIVYGNVSTYVQEKTTSNYEIV